MLNRLGARAILSNVLLTAFVWSMLDQDIDALKSLVGETFAKKKALLELNMRCIDEGYSFVDPEQGTISVALPPPDKGFASHLLITGSQAMGTRRGSCGGAALCRLSDDALQAGRNIRKQQRDSVGFLRGNRGRQSMIGRVRSQSGDGRSSI